MKRHILIALLLASFVTGIRNAHATEKNESKAKRELIHALSKSHDPDRIKEIFEDERLAIVTEKETDPGLGLMTPDSIDCGVDYWKEHRVTLEKASRRYHIPEEMIVSIMRVETDFGGNVGTDPALNTLYTIYAQRPGKKDYAQKEISALIRYAEITHRDIFEIPGSKEGAIGLPQFMPSSYAAYAVDGNDDGVVELFSDIDAIMSAANYLAAHSWAESDKSQHDAVFAYNHSKRYVSAIFTYARAVRQEKERHLP